MPSEEYSPAAADIYCTLVSLGVVTRSEGIEDTFVQ
jgi:hypothetical protein